MAGSAIGDDDLIARIAWLYYKEKLNQQEIADLISLSRQKVQRLLERARDLDVIHFFVKHPNYNIFSIERDLARVFGLKDAVVIPQVPGDEEKLRRGIAKAGAAYFEMLVRTEEIDIAGIGWGNTISYIADYLVTTVKPRLQLVTLVGSINSNSQANALSIVMKLASKLEVSFHHVMCPAVVENSETGKILKQEPSIRKSLDIAAKASTLLISVGEVTETAALFAQGILDEKDYKLLSGKGAEGEVLGRFIDGGGNVIQDDTHNRIISVPLEMLKDPEKTVICVSGGLSKLSAIRAALAGGYIDILITDELVAEKLISNG
jgi:DNA-binding transcriptional regulator LsrR (DeoR family)